MDVVYLYSAGSNTNEIKYSRRSFEKHLTGIDRFFIVGDDPGIFNDIIHIPVENKYKGNRARNIYEKILAACRRPDISKSFLCASDDHFLLKDFNASTFPYFHCGQFTHTINRLTDKNYYKAYVVSTYKALLARKVSTLYFNVHTPIVYEKEKYIEVMQSYDWEVLKGYISKSLYANSLGLTGEYTNDCKIFNPKTKTAIRRKLRETPFFSTDENCFNAEMLEYLQEVYPKASPGEI